MYAQPDLIDGTFICVIPAYLLHNNIPHSLITELEIKIIIRCYIVDEFSTLQG